MYKNLQKNYKNPVKKVVVRRMGICSTYINNKNHKSKNSLDQNTTTDTILLSNFFRTHLICFPCYL